MNEIFTIQQTEDDWEMGSSDIGFVLTEEEAKNTVKKLTEEYKAKEKFTTEFDNKVVEFQKVNYPELEPHLPIPKWDYGLKKSDITQEMLKERDTIKGKNEMIDFRNSQKIGEYMKLECPFVTSLYEAAPEEMKKHFIIVENTDGKFTEMNNCSLASVPYSYTKLTKLIIS